MDKKETITRIFTDFSAANLQQDIMLEKCFYSTYKQFEKRFGCVYLSYVLESERMGKNVQFSTSKEWSAFYYKNGLSEKCHIAKICRDMKAKRCSYTINWNLILPDDIKSRKTHILRREFGFDNGITYATILNNRYFGSYFELINIVGNNLDINFYKEIHQNKFKVFLILKDLRTKGCAVLSNRLNVMVCNYMNRKK